MPPPEVEPAVEVLLGVEDAEDIVVVVVLLGVSRICDCEYACPGVVAREGGLVIVMFNIGVQVEDVTGSAVD